ncbi:carbohydrate ABC transporter permease [Halomonas sp. SpR8]|uniref:carbohydrate ABC transporter permease n=1 Tax=Halomonas sp. SpR8 TaxID=3050463 RepID=UPI0027E455E8|nr:carbohydrate ABC transporter permease [Halomonas sp. SpR8]MDQ7729040.1 carbohydrate ABC transporter permease [Halomonas sp. SpR8]
MNTTTNSNAKNSKTYASRSRYVFVPSLETVAAWLLAVIWVFPLLYAFWAAFHPSEFMVNFQLFAPLTLENFTNAWSQAPFARYYLNTFALVTGVVIGQFIVCTLAAFAFARFPIPGKNVLFMLVLIQLFVFPEVLIVENYRIASELGLINTITGIGLPYVASALGIFLLRQTFKTIPQELEDAARIEGCNWLEILWKVYVPLAKPTYLAYGLVSISHHWNNFIWPLVVTNSVESRPLTVGLGVFSAPETGVNWATVSAATLLSIAPLLVAFLLFQRQFVQSFLRAGIR